MYQSPKDMYSFPLFQSALPPWPDTPKLWWSFHLSLSNLTFRKVLQNHILFIHSFHLDIVILFYKHMHVSLPVFIFLPNNRLCLHFVVFLTRLLSLVCTFNKYSIHIYWINSETSNLSPNGDFYLVSQFSQIKGIIL